MTGPLNQHPVVGDVGDRFQDFDLEAVYSETKREAGSKDCQNFVVEFGPGRARVARDLGVDDFRSILDRDTREDEYPIRWM